MFLRDLPPLVFALASTLSVLGSTPNSGARQELSRAADPTFEQAVIREHGALSSYAGIDRLLEGHALIPLGADWAFFPGTQEPSDGSDWAQADFDDSSWAKGPSPFAFGTESLGTQISEFGEGVSTVYLRRRLELPDPKLYDRILLELPVDDGFVFYLNGQEERRRSAGASDQRNAFDGGASSPREVDSRPMPVVDLTRAVIQGDNTLAIQGLVFDGDAETFEILPRLWGKHHVTPRGEQWRYEVLSRYLPEENNTALSAYLKGRTQQRSGALEQAAACFLTAATETPNEPEPWARLVDCHRALGSQEALLQVLGLRIQSGTRTAAILDTWTSLFLDSSTRSVLDLPGGFPNTEVPAESALYRDALWLGSTLAAGSIARVNCGASEDMQAADSTLSRDRFFSVASRSRSKDADGFSESSKSARVATRSIDSADPTYSIPLPSGAYSLRLGFSASDAAEELPDAASFDVVLNGARVLRGIAPGKIEQTEGCEWHGLPLFVDRGLVTLDLLPNQDFDPWIAGWEVEASNEEDFQDAIDAWIEVDPKRAFPRVQLAKLYLSQRDLRGALTQLEAAEDLADFQLEDDATLSAVRVRLLPELVSFASVDGLLEDAAGGTLAPLDSARTGSGAYSTYLVARTDQMAGRVDDAIAGFEALVMDGSLAYQPYLRMAQCLAELDFAPEADQILDSALKEGVEPAPELLNFLIALRLGGLGMDPWEVLRGLRSFDLPSELIVVPTSESAPQLWSYSSIEPPTITWSRLTYDTSRWKQGAGVIGTGESPEVIVRSLWNTETVFARRTARVEDTDLLYPHLRANAADALDVYLNATRVLSLGISTSGYRDFPLRPSAVVPIANAKEAGVLVRGDNGLGMYANNSTGPACCDVGLVQPLDELIWIQDQLDQAGAIRINCGGDAFVAPDGTAWSEDRFFGWGQAYGVDRGEALPDIQGTENDELYYTTRWFFDDVNTTWYQVPLPNGHYSLRLHFAEIDPDFKQPGSRNFDLRAEGVLLLDDFDPVASAGFRAAEVHTFEVDISDGYLDLHLNGPEFWSFLSGLEILR